MRNAKLWSLLLAVVLLCGLALGVLFIGADAAGTLELNVGGAGEFATVEAALNSVAETDLSAYESITVKVNGDVTETFNGDLLFGQKTIWKETGVMMPITITGAHSITLPVGTSKSPQKIANANDITFVGVTLPIRDKYVRIFAGSGHLSFDACSFGSSNYNYRLYADNYTASVFDGWTEADYYAMKDGDGHINTSVTLKNGNYPTNSNYNVAAVGSSSDFEANIGSVKISANNTKTEVNWENVSTTYFYLRSGTNPVAKTTLNITDCTTSHGYRAAGFASDVSSAPEIYTGDIEINVVGGTYKNYGRLLHTCKLVADTSSDKAQGVADGNLTVSIKDAAYDATTNGEGKNYIQICYSGCVIEGDFKVTYENMSFYRCFINNGNNGTVMGDYSATIKNVDSCTFYGGFGTVCGSVTNNLSNVDVTMRATAKTSVLDGIKLFQGMTVGDAERYTGDHPETVGNIDNTLTDCTFTCGSSYGELKNTTSITYMTLGAYAAGVISGNITNRLNNVNVEFKQIRLIAGNFAGEVRGNVTTELNGGSYVEYVGSEGALVKGDITNIVKGDVTFKDSFYAGGYFENSSLTVKGKIINKILKDENGNEPVFLANDTKFSFYGGGHHTILESGVENIIEAGTFENIVQCGSFRPSVNSAFGADENGYSIINRISGGTFKNYFYGGIASFEDADTSAGETTATIEGSIYNEISGGTFTGNRVALGNRFAPLGENNPIVNKITGGVFSCPVYLGCGGYSSISSGDVASVSSTIENGVFERAVYAGNHGTTKVGNSCILNVLGGTFKADLVAGSSDNVDYDVSFSITQTEGKQLKFYGHVLNVDTFTGNGQVIEIGKNTNITCASANGSFTLLQTEGWDGHDYFAAPATCDLAVQEASAIYGVYELIETDTILLKGGYAISAATLILEERVGIRVLLDPDKVAIYRDNFSYSVAKSGEEPFMQGTELEKWTDPESGKTYDSFVIYGIGLGDFDQLFTVNVFGARKEEFSVYDLAELAGTVWTGDWKAVADAICNLTTVYTSETGVHDEAALPLLDVAQDLVATRDANVVTAASVSLLMSDAVGIELKATLAEGYASALTVKVNGQLIENALTLDGQTATVTLLFDAAYMSDAFVLEIADASGASIFSLTTSIEKLAGDLAANAENPAQENAQALLYYIQKVAKVA